MAAAGHEPNPEMIWQKQESKHGEAESYFVQYYTHKQYRPEVCLTNVRKRIFQGWRDKQKQQISLRIVWTDIFYSSFQKGESLFLHYVNNVKVYGKGKGSYPDLAHAAWKKSADHQVSLETCQYF